MKVQLITNKMVEEISPGLQNLGDQTMSHRPKPVDSETVLQTIELYLVSSIWRVSGGLIISLSLSLSLV